MGAVTTSLGDGLADIANQTVTLSAGEDLFSNITTSSTSSFVSGGFDSLGNSYTVRPIAISDVTVVVGKSGSANTGVRPIFKTSFTGDPFVNSTVIVFTGPLANSTDFLLSTELLYLYPTFASTPAYYGFEQAQVGGSIEYSLGSSGGRSLYKGTTKLQNISCLSGSITQVSIPSAPGNVNASSVTDTTANITWTAPADDGMQSPAAYSAANIKGYRINYRNSDSENWKVFVANTGSNTLSRVVTDLLPSTYYEVQVAALNAVTDAHNSSYTSITAHVGERSATYSFTTSATTNNARIWTGSEFKKSIIKIWSGTAWIQYPNVRAKVWDGTITTRTNLVANPNFETNTTNWSVTYGLLSRVTTTPQIGTYCLQIDSDGDGYLSAAYVKSNSFSIGTSYRAGLWVRAASAGYNLQLTLSDNGSSTANTAFIVTTSWQFVQTPSITATGTTATLSIDGYPVNDPIFVDSAIIETTSTYTGTFFDGNTPDSGVVDYAWTGTANASTSTAINSGFKELALDS